MPKHTIAGSNPSVRERPTGAAKAGTGLPEDEADGGPSDARPKGASEPGPKGALLDPSAFKRLFQLEPDVTFLNHGSYGATPIPVFEAYLRWQRRMERQPVRFFRDELSAHLMRARQVLAASLNAPASDVVFVPNATFGVNLAARSLRLGAGDEVLSTDHEYGACDNAWNSLAAERGYAHVKATLPLPLGPEDDVVERIWRRVTPRTRVLFMSHISSATAQTLPVAALCARAREAGIITIVDGAHGPGQVPLDLPAIGADIYTGNCHKWLLSPKGAAFLYATPAAQAWLEPLIIGWRRVGRPSLGSAFQDDNEMLGTDDYSAYLSVPDAIAFQREHAWPLVARACHERLVRVLPRIEEVTGAPSMYLREGPGFRQMAVVALPGRWEAASLQQTLLREHRIEVPVTAYRDQQFLRVSVQAYNDDDDMDRMVEVIGELMASA